MRVSADHLFPSVNVCVSVCGCVGVCVCVLVDDGSGVLSCVQWRRTKDSSEGLYVASLGQLVSVLGQAEEFREERQLRVTAISESCVPRNCVCVCVCVREKGSDLIRCIHFCNSANDHHSSLPFFQSIAQGHRYSIISGWVDLFKCMCVGMADL